MLDIVQARHQTAAIPSDKGSLQLSFTKGRSASDATVILSETVAEAKDGKRTLLVASLDIQKAVDVISHSHLLWKLYLTGLPCRWWILKENYTNMCSRVSWQGELGRKFTREVHHLSGESPVGSR